MDNSLFNKAKQYLVGGVNSPVRSFRAVGGSPVFIKQGKGSNLYDEQGGKYIDFCLSWGALILGHAYPEVVKKIVETVKKGTSFGAATKIETELAAIISEAVPSIALLRMTSSGTEAVMGAIRLARAFTKKDKILKFEGAYHGHSDSLLVKPGSGAATLGIPDSQGIPEDFTRNTIVVPFNHPESIEKAVLEYKDSLAAVIVEPVQANCGVIPPQDNFLSFLRDITSRNKILLIFDEVITGFRLTYGGAQKMYGITPDLTCLGKIIGGGMPVGAFGGRREVMELLAPLGSVYQAGTLSGNPVAVTAGITTLNILKETDPYDSLKAKTASFCNKVKFLAQKHSIKIKLNTVSSMFSIFFTDNPVVDYKSASLTYQKEFAAFFHGLIKKGVYFSPSAFETNFISTVHSQDDINETLNAIDDIFSFFSSA